MSRIGKKPIVIPIGVDVKIAEDNFTTVKGPKGTLTQNLHKNMIFKTEGNTIIVDRPTESKENKSLHGLTRTLLDNMIVGVSEGFKKELNVNGTGYRVQKQGKQIVMNLGYSHQVIMEEIPGITVDVPNQNTIIVSGCDKQIVGQYAAEVRGKRPPEPYKGKGIKYSTEVIKRKEGKTGKAKQ